MATIIKNNGGSAWTLSDTNPAITIPASGQSDLEDDLSLALIAQSDQLLADLANGALSLVCNDGSKDLSVAAAVRHILQRPAPGPTDATDGKPLMTIFPAKTGWKTHFSGAGDDLDPPVGQTGLSDGQAIELACTGGGSAESVEWQYSSPNEIHDGQLSWNPDNFDGSDKFCFSAKVPANTPVVNGTTTGNCNLVDAGGYNVIVPAAGDGTHDITLSSACPVKAPNSDGYWDVDYETGAITASATPGQAKFHLLDIAQEAYVCKNIALAHKHGVFDIEAYRVEWVHQSWKMKLHCTKNSAGAGTLYGWLLRFVKSQT